MKDSPLDVASVSELAKRIAASAGVAFRGKPEVIEQMLVALFASGHVLIEDVPGTGKTVLAKAIARSLNSSFSRIQCTPDLMPADVTGSFIFSPKTQKFRFRKGPILSALVLVDELNRATPRTQSALLEAMAESQVSIDGHCFPLPEPFFLIATENPIESEGTFPLPEAQKDRFMLSLTPGYPDAADEALIIESHRRMDNPVEDIVAVASSAEILECRAKVVQVYVEASLRDYLVAVSRATRKDPHVEVGISPRGSIALYKAAQALAAIRGRNYVIPEDIKEMVLPVFRKRLIIKPEFQMSGYTSDSIITEMLTSIPLPAFKERS
ncbi:MAG TPA: MoxR family ATPase [Treponemataceae bacterium]|nr:MoxR family ATPase [Treponemataceae bacterium]